MGTKPKEKRTTKKVFLKCEISEGMFKGEKIICIQVEGENKSFTIPEGLVHQGMIEVTIIKRKSDKCLIRISGEPFSSGRKIWVPKEMLYI